MRETCQQQQQEAAESVGEVRSAVTGPQGFVIVENLKGNDLHLLATFLVKLSVGIRSQVLMVGLSIILGYEGQFQKLQWSISAV